MERISFNADSSSSSSYHSIYDSTEKSMTCKLTIYTYVSSVRFVTLITRYSSQAITVLYVNFLWRL